MLYDANDILINILTAYLIIIHIHLFMYFICLKTIIFLIIFRGDSMIMLILTFIVFMWKLLNEV